MAFAVEEIPDAAILFRRVHESQFVSNNKPSSACFDQERMSVNWAKYSTAEKTAKPNSAAVVSLSAGECRSLKQTVEHSPIERDEEGNPNQAHAEVCGTKKPKSLRYEFVRLAKVVWKRAPSPESAELEV